MRLSCLETILWFDNDVYDIDFIATMHCEEWNHGIGVIHDVEMMERPQFEARLIYLNGQMDLFIRHYFLKWKKHIMFREGSIIWIRYKYDLIWDKIIRFKSDKK